MISVDRINGVSGDLAIKTPVRVATTANITLEGLQTIDGVALAAGDRVLVWQQTSAVDNGIWVANTSAWSRALDFDGRFDVVQGTMIPVVSGTVNGGSAFKLDTASPVVGTSSLSFSVANDFALRGNLAVPGGSSLVGFIQAGTGAVATTVLNRLRQVVSVKDFGAVGNGTTDDTAAIQAAINYCVDNSTRKQTLYFPPNDAAAAYKITAPLTITNSLNIVGAGERAVTILASGFSAGQYILNFDCAAVDVVEHALIEGVTLKGANSTPSGVRVSNLSYLLMKQVTLYTLTTGVRLTGTRTFSNFFEQVTGYQITESTVRFSAFSGGGHYQFTGCTFTGADGFRMDTDSATDSVAFHNCNFEQCTTTDALIEGTINGLLFSGCRSEGLDGAQSFLINPTAGKIVTGLVVQGCFWQTDFGNSVPVYLSGDVRGFSITGNRTANAAALQFVTLNGTGSAGVIAGNYLENAPQVVSATRAGVTIFNNYNSSGALPEFWGTATWGVTQTSFTASATGLTTVPTGSVAYTVIGNTVTLDVPAFTGTSNATTFTLTGGPVAIRPATDKDFIVRVVDNGAAFVAGIGRVKTTGVIELYATISGGAFTAAGTKTVGSASFSYTLT